MTDGRTGRRWVVKALYEASGELRELLMSGLRAGSPTAVEGVERAWRGETIAAWQLAHLLFQDVDEIPLHDLEWLEQRTTPDAYEQLREFGHLREQVCGVLGMISEWEWERQASHRFQGEISVESIARGAHQRDLEILVGLRREVEV